MIKKLFLWACLAVSLSVFASPDQQERSAKCQFEAMVTQLGFQSRFQLDKEEFEAKIKELVEGAAKDPEITKEQVEDTVRALRQGFAGISPQKAFDACMNRKQV